MVIEDPTAKVRASFGRSAEAYAGSDVHARGESLGLLVNLLQPESGWRVLDVASGAGHAGLAFAPRVEHVTACDLTPEMLRTTGQLAGVRGLANVGLALGDAGSLPARDGVFDLVLCRLAFHHFPEPLKALRECARVLKPDGLLGFTDNITVDTRDAADYYNAFERLRDPSHQRVYPLRELTGMMEEAGFGIREFQRLTKEFEFQDWAERQHVSNEDKERLLSMMRELPDSLRELFAPRWEDGTVYFRLWEAVIVAKGP